MNITASYIRRNLQGRYDPREAGNLSRIICCEILGQQTVDYYLGKDIILSVKEEQELESILSRLHNFEPIQYILGEARFVGRTLGMYREKLYLLLLLIVRLCRHLYGSNSAMC